VQAHHALVDGIDMGRFFEIFQGYCQQPEAVFS
jgi:chloramphenicol O-acetyltransferase